MSQEAVDNIEIIEVDMYRTSNNMEDMDNPAFRPVNINSTDIRGTYTIHDISQGNRKSSYVSR
jgi:hypothetical protein